MTNKAKSKMLSKMNAAQRAAYHAGQRACWAGESSCMPAALEPSAAEMAAFRKGWFNMVRTLDKYRPGYLEAA